MQNLAGNKECDQFIKDELYLANIPAISTERTRSEVPYTVIGKIGNWTLTRAWYYWIAKVETPTQGLPLKQAMELHNRKHPTKDEILGKIIRSGGHCGCPSPDDYGADPIYNDELNVQLEALGYKKEYVEFLKESFIKISVGEVSKLCNEGKLNVERYVTCYHIDDQIGLNEFAKCIQKTLG